jgi:UDP-glucose 4-epimerase
LPDKRRAKLLQGEKLMKVAITGCSSGFARVLLPLLEADSNIEKIIGTDIVEPGFKPAKLEFQRKDIRSINLKDSFADCDVMVHLAFVVGRPYKMSLRECAEINLKGTWNACRAAAEAGVKKLVIASSIAAYGGFTDNPPLITEDSPLQGLFSDFYYSQHKHANEMWLDNFQREFPAILITRLRPCVVMGVTQLVANSLRVTNNTFVSSGNARKQLIQFVHENDLAEAFHAAIVHDLPGAYNVVGEKPMPLPVMAEMEGFKVRMLPGFVYRQAATLAWRMGQTPLGPEWLNLDELKIFCTSEKLMATGKWKPRYNTQEAFSATVKMLKNANG